MGKTEAFETTRDEIDRKLGTFNFDMMKIEYLENCLKNHLLSDSRKFVHLKLAELYEKKLMTHEAVKHMEAVAEASISFKDKKEAYMKKIELFIKNNALMESEDTFKKALACANAPKEKSELKEDLKALYLKRAGELENSGRANNSLKFYEKLFALEPNNQELIKKLAVIYNRVGKVREAIKMEGMIREMK